MPSERLHVKIETSDGEVLVDEDIDNSTDFEQRTTDHAMRANESGNTWVMTISDPDDLIPTFTVHGGSRPN